MYKEVVLRTERKCLESVKNRFRSGQTRLRQVMSGKVISEGYVKRGQVRLGQVRSCPDWSRQVKSGKVTYLKRRAINFFLDPNFF